MLIKIKYVALSNGRWVYRPRKTKELTDYVFSVDSRGFLKPPIKLGVQGDSYDQIASAYIAAKESLLTEASFVKSQLGYICSSYLTSETFNEKALGTQKSYHTLSVSILSHNLKINGNKATLADIQLESLTKPLMNKIRKKRLEAAHLKSQDGRVQINREISFLSTAIGWGLNNIPELPQIANPLKGIDKFKEQANTRYVSDEEMLIQCREANEIMDYLPLLIRLSYLLGTRGAETATLRYSDCIDEGINVERLKRSKANIIAWSPALKELITDAKALNKTRKIIEFDPPILTNSNGDKLSTSAIQSAMGRLKKHMKKKGLEEVFFTLHKTKSKAQSDSKDDNISGLSSQMKDRYNTKKHVIKTGLK